MGVWTNRMLRKRLKALGLKPDASGVARADRACNTTDTQRKLRKEEARARGLGGVRRMNGSAWTPPKTPGVD